MIKLLLVFCFGITIFFFQNCSFSGTTKSNSIVDPPSTPENFLWLETTVPSGLNSVNYFKSSKPVDMSGESGYEFLYYEYIQPKCIACHRPPAGQLPHFGILPARDSYQVAKSKFIDYDIHFRITRNPHCSACNLDERGEVFQAFRYWLSHR